MHTFAEITAWLRAPLTDKARRRGRYVAGAVALGGAFAVMHGGGGDVASAAPARHAVSAPTASVTTYTVKPGDTLSHVAKRFGTSVAEIVRLNSLRNADYIVSGRTLLLPSTGQTTSRATPASPPPPPTPKRTAVVGPKTLPTTGAYSSKPTPGQALPSKLAARPERVALRPHFVKAAADYGVPLELLEAMAWNESGWQNTVVSGTGAVGIGQLMPATIDFVNENLVTKPLDAAKPEQNIRMSAAFLRYLLKESGNDSRMALAAYYQGLASVRTQGVYAETDQYVRTVLAVQRTYF
jgi:N-acetylmuramoyl-L-alanine amidase